MENNIKKINEVKQIIIVRNDIFKLVNKSKGELIGKISAQVAHASIAAYLLGFDISSKQKRRKTFQINSSNRDIIKWTTKSFTKIILKVDNLKDLLLIKQQCDDNNIKNVLIKDEGRTVFNKPTITCLGIIPIRSNIIDPITGALKKL